VLSFPARTADSIGDIVISYERARAQARAAGWRIADELDLLAVHGTLHLLGYDDLQPRARKKMWERQEQILARKIPPKEYK
jgi:probable rRNA maturation factor